MRIAVLFYGRIANFKEHYYHSMYVFGKENTIDFFLSSDNAPQESIDDFISIYKPVSFINTPIVYSIDLSKYPGKREETVLDSMTRHFINKQRVFTLLEDHISLTSDIYDLILCTRIDIVYGTKICFEQPEENTIYIPHDITHYYDNWMNDHFAYGSYDVMKKYASLYDRCPYLIEEGKSIPHPEALTFANLSDYGIQPRRFHIQYTIERLPYTKERPPYGIICD
jgi:hypothetical protein